MKDETKNADTIKKSEEQINIDFSQAMQLYGSLVQLTIHGQENMWWMIYIFLTFNSILLLSCAALFNANEYTYNHRILLALFTVAGIVTDFCWFRMAGNYHDASRAYADTAEAVEKNFPEALRPLTKREAGRKPKNQLGENEIHFISRWIPVGFMVIYGIVAVLAGWFVPIKEVKNKVDAVPFTASVGTIEKRLDSISDALKVMLEEHKATYEELRSVRNSVDILQRNTAQDAVITELKNRLHSLEQKGLPVIPEQKPTVKSRR